MPRLLPVQRDRRFRSYGTRAIFSCSSGDVQTLGARLRGLMLGTKAAITVGLLAYLFSKIDMGAIRDHMARGDANVLALGLAVLGAQPILGAIRWQLIMRWLGLSVPLSAVARWTYIGTFFSQVLPATVGADAVRMWQAYRGGCPARLAMNSVGLDRVVMGFSLVVLLGCATPWLGEFLQQNHLQYLLQFIIIAAASGLCCVMLADRVPGSWRRFRLVRGIGNLAEDARSLFLKPRSALTLLALSILSYLNIILAVYIFASSFGATAGFLQFSVLLTPVLVASTVPLSIGGWGTREVAMIAALGTIGISPEIAILASVWLGIGSIIISLPGAVTFLLGDGRSWRRAHVAPYRPAA